MEETLVELLGLPDVPHVVFKQSPLRLALCQVRFTRVLGVAQTSFVAPFQEAIRELYPVAQPTQEVNIEIGVGPGAARLQQRQSGSRWQFKDREDNWTLVLTEEFLGLETRLYDSFGDFVSRLEKALEALERTIRPAFVTRLGLRYVNEIRTESLVWSEILSPELLGPLVVPQFIKGVKQSTQELLLQFGEYGVNIRHGLFPRATTVRPRPGSETSPELSQPFYLLDLDAYRQFPLPGGFPLDIPTICETVRTFNRTNYRLFRWALTEQYLEKLGVLRHASD